MIASISVKPHAAIHFCKFISTSPQTSKYMGAIPTLAKKTNGPKSLKSSTTMVENMLTNFTLSEWPRRHSAQVLRPASLTRIEAEKTSSQFEKTAIFSGIFAKNRSIVGRFSLRSKCYRHQTKLRSSCNNRSHADDRAALQADSPDPHSKPIDLPPFDSQLQSLLQVGLLQTSYPALMG